MNMEEKIDCIEKNGEGEKEVKEVVVEVEEDEEVVLPGFRFHPTDEELVGFYLRRKVDNKPLSIQIIKQIDIYKYDPWDLPKPTTVGGEKEWYFFCLRGRKYRNSIRPNRVTGSGFWKATGIDRPICSASNNECIGLKKSLVYYRGSAGKGTKTDWMMHEFRLPANNKSDANTSPSMQEAEVWTVCRIFKRNLSGKKYSTQGWKQSIANQTTTQTDSSSKTSSIDSDHTRGADNYTYMGCDNLQQDQHFPKNYFDDKSNNQAFGASQWSNSSVQVQQPLVANTTLPISITTPNLNANEFFLKDGNWDELGRMMEYMMEPSMQQDCIYYY